MHFRFSRVGQSFTMPILLDPSPSAVFVFWATAIPAAMGLIVKKTIVDPRKRLHKAKKLERLRHANADLIRAHKQEAEDAVRLMKEQILRKTEAEEARNGKLHFFFITLFQYILNESFIYHWFCH